jgi:plasmid stabilization system protein ParE
MEILFAVDDAETSLARGEGRIITQESMRDLAKTSSGEAVRGSPLNRRPILMAHRRAPQADLDLDDIWLYIAKKGGSFDIADGLIDSITERFFLLGRHPYVGRARDEELRRRLRSFPVGEYVIPFRIGTRTP